MKMAYDDQYLVTVSEDACVMIWKVSDKEGRGLKRDKEVGYAEEILITKSDLEEKVSWVCRVGVRPAVAQGSLTAAHETGNNNQNCQINRRPFKENRHWSLLRVLRPSHKIYADNLGS